MRFSTDFAATVVALVTLSGCMTNRGATVEPLPPPPSTAAPASTTVPPDFSAVALPRARGASTTTTIALGPGKATLKGTVSAPEGPVTGALVRVERLLNDKVATMDVATQADGTWTLPDIKGGAYRVRAWKVPDLALVQPALFFLGATNTFGLDLKLERYAGPFPTSAVAPNPPLLGAPTNLVVQLDQRSVDDRGFVVAVPLAGVGVQLASTTGGWLVASANPAVTDSNGRARWVLRCGAIGAQPLSVTLTGATSPLPLAVPACTEIPVPAPTGSIPPSTTVGPGSTTSTTRATVTTTRPAPTTTQPTPTTTRR
ncbi:MAG: carboxypeptidase-like regulatory domain-containing protein [Acidimicrobiales bacterium]